MSRVVDLVGAIARHQAERRPACDLAVVTSTFDGDDGDDTHTVSIAFKHSGLALTRVPVACGITGGAVLPRPGDVVLVLMPRGDLASAVVIGPVYSDERRPPAFTRDEVALVWPGDADDPDTGAVDLRVLADGSSRAVTITLGGDKDARLAVEDGEISLVAGGATVRVAHASTSDATIEVAAGGTRVSLKQDGDLTIEAAGSLILKGRAIEIEGQTQVKINGQTVDIN